MIGAPSLDVCLLCEHNNSCNIHIIIHLCDKYTDVVMLGCAIIWTRSLEKERASLRAPLFRGRVSLFFCAGRSKPRLGRGGEAMIGIRQLARLCAGRLPLALCTAVSKGIGFRCWALWKDRSQSPLSCKCLPFAFAGSLFNFGPMPRDGCLCHAACYQTPQPSAPLIALKCRGSKRTGKGSLPSSPQENG